MGRVLGRIEYGDDQPPRYFIHCNTTGWSTKRVFATPQEAWQCYGIGGLDAVLGQRASVANTAIYGVLIVIPDEGDSPCSPATYGLATLDSLLVPLSLEQAAHCLLEAGGQLHVAVEVRAGFAGDYDQPLCNDHWISKEGEQSMPFESYLGQRVDLCMACRDRLMGGVIGLIKPDDK